MEGVPSEQETIAVKRSKRISQKLHDARVAFFAKREWWSDGQIEFLGLALILVLNFVVIVPFFGSFSSSMIFSGPIIPLLAKMFTVFGMPLPFAVQLINLIFMLLFPITFYFFVRKISQRKFPAFISALIVSLPIYPFLYSRIDSGLLGSEGSFMSSLPAIFLSLIMLLNFLRKGEIKNLIYVSVVSSLIALFSPFGFFCYVILAIITTFSEILLGDGRLKFFRLVTSLFFAGTLSSFWYNPAFFYWMIMGKMGDDIRSLIKKLVPISFFTIPVLATLGYLLFDRKPDLQPLFLATFYTIVFAIFALAGEGFAPTNPGRYIHLFGISLGFLLGIASLNIIEHIQKIKKIKNFILAAICVVLIVFTVMMKDGIGNSNSNVLGVWTDVGKGDIWLAKDEFGQRYSFFGYAITFFGIGSLTYLYKSSKMPSA